VQVETGWPTIALEEMIAEQPAWAIAIETSASFLCVIAFLAV
jgi:hypothetical protein